MADKVNALKTAKPNNPRFESGTKVRTVEYRAAVTSANSAAGDKFFLVSGLSLSDRITGFFPGGAGTPALTSATDCDLGFFYQNGSGEFVALDADVLWDGVTLAYALTYRNLLKALNTSLDWSKNIGEHLNLGPDAVPHKGVWLVLTTNNANTATGPLNLDLVIEIDEATTK
jgi:hypothetical protein